MQIGPPLFGEVLQEASKSAEKLTSEHPTVLRNWDRVLLDRGHHLDVDETVVGRPAREEFVASLPSVLLGTMQERASTSQWFGLWRASLNCNKGTCQDELRFTRGTVMTNLCIEKKIVSTAEDLCASAVGAHERMAKD